MTSPKVKICCISSIQEAKLAIKYGASALGLVGKMPSGPGVIDDELICEINQHIPPSISSFLLTSETSANAIIEHYNKVNTSTIQLVDSIKIDDYEEIRDNLPHVNLVQVIHVIDEKSVEEAILVSDFVDAILLDSGNPNLPVKKLGGTGKTHNWELSSIIRKSVSKPVFLAGGIHAGNVKQAIKQVKPFGIDLCSGVRTDGKLDEEKLKMFFNQINS